MKKKTLRHAQKLLRGESSGFMSHCRSRIVVAQVLGKQVLRSGTSVGANYREARRGRSKAEFISKIGDCLKEADETLYWLELLAEENILPAKQLAPLLKETDELVAIFVSSSKRARGDS